MTSTVSKRDAKRSAKPRQNITETRIQTKRRKVVTSGRSKVHDGHRDGSFVGSTDETKPRINSERRTDDEQNFAFIKKSKCIVFDLRRNVFPEKHYSGLEPSTTTMTNRHVAGVE